MARKNKKPFGSMSEAQDHLKRKGFTFKGVVIFGADGVVNTLDFVGRGQAGGIGAAHGAGYHERTDFFCAFFPQQVDGQRDILRRGAAGTGDQAGARIGNFRLAQAGILDRLLHRDVIVCSAVAHETAQLAVDQAVQVDIDSPMNMAAKAEFLVLGAEHNA